MGGHRARAAWSIVSVGGVDENVGLRIERVVVANLGTLFEHVVTVGLDLARRRYDRIDRLGACAHPLHQKRMQAPIRPFVAFVAERGVRRETMFAERLAREWAKR